MVVLPPPPDPPGCANCGTPATGAYCAVCGQPAGAPTRSVHDFALELLGGLFAFDGRVWRSLVPLFVRPGALTRAWIEGRRASFVPPLRLFLFFSILLFLVVSCETDVNTLLSLPEAQAEQAVPAGDAAQNEGFEIDLPLPEWRIFDGLRRRFAEQETRLESLPAPVRGYVMARRGLELAPIALLLLLPLLASFLRLWWLRSGLLWLDHFTLLLHAYAAYCGFAALLLLLPTPGWLWTAAFLAGAPIYAHRAMRVAYRRGFWRTGLATLAGGVATFAALVAVLLVLAPYAVLTF